MATEIITPDQTGDDVHIAAQGLKGDPQATIEIRAGDYLYTDDIELPDHITVKGDAEGRVNLVADGPYAIRKEGGVGPSVDITIEDLTVDGGGHGTWGIYLPQPQNVTVEDVTVRNAGPRTAAGTSGAVGTPTRGDAAAGAVDVLGVTIENCAGTLIDCGGTTGGQAHDITIRKCSIRAPNYAASLTRAISLEGCGKARLEDNDIDGANGHLLAVDVTEAVDCRLEGNTIRRGYGAVHGASASGVEMADNTVIDQHHGVFLSSGLGLTVRDTLFRDIETFGVRGQGAQVDVLDNRFDACRHAARLFDLPRSVDMSGNVVKNGTKPHVRTLQLDGDLADQPARCELKGNEVDIDSGYLMARPATDIQENTVLDCWAACPAGSIEVLHDDSIVSANVMTGSVEGCGTWAGNFEAVTPVS